MSTVQIESETRTATLADGTFARVVLYRGPRGTYWWSVRWDVDDVPYGLMSSIGLGTADVAFVEAVAAANEARATGVRR